MLELGAPRTYPRSVGEAADDQSGRPHEGRPRCGGRAMAHTRTPAAEPSIDVDDVSRVLDQNGERVPNADLDRWVADIGTDELQKLYRDMVVVRRIDAEGMALQRQGQ